MITTPETVSVLNLPIHLLDDYTTWLMDRLNHRQGTHVVTLNAEMAILAEKDPHIAQIIREADLVIPDGAGVVFYLRLRGYRQSRCPGIELAESLLTQIGQQENGDKVAFYGGKPGLSDQAAQHWQNQSSHLSIMANHGYLSAPEQEKWQETLKHNQPGLILVGLGVPRQEDWIRQNRHLCPHAIWIGVGGSFDIWSGTKTRAPQWLRENHLEWLYRLYQEPWRWRRMLALPQFFWRSLITF